MARTKAMKDLYIELLEDSFDSEQQIVKALPKMAKAAHAARLKKAFESHLVETTSQVERLEKVFQSLGVKPSRKACEATHGLIEEVEAMIRQQHELAEGVLDAALIACGQKLEHYEIASYGTLCTIAQVLGHDDQLGMLTSTLKEEKAADEILTDISNTVNLRSKAA